VGVGVCGYGCGLVLRGMTRCTYVRTAVYFAELLYLRSFVLSTVGNIVEAHLMAPV